MTGAWFVRIDQIHLPAVARARVKRKKTGQQYKLLARMEHHVAR
jgi:hypothetical protein